MTAEDFSNEYLVSLLCGQPHLKLPFADGSYAGKHSRLYQEARVIMPQEHVGQAGFGLCLEEFDAADSDCG